LDWLDFQLFRRGTKSKQIDDIRFGLVQIDLFVWKCN